jgi:hypothetical protein
LAESKDRWLAIPKPPDEDLRDRLVKQLQAVAAISGTADLTRIHGPYTAWLKDTRSADPPLTQVEALSSFFVRLSVTPSSTPS